MSEGLPWFRADSNLPSHDKILELVSLKGGKGAAFVYVCSIAYSVGHGTDGFIRKAALPFIHATPAEARLLVDNRLWVLVEGGFQIKNFGTRQMVAAEAHALHVQRSEAGKKGAARRWPDDNE